MKLAAGAEDDRTETAAAGAAMRHAPSMLVVVAAVACTSTTHPGPGQGPDVPNVPATWSPPAAPVIPVCPTAELIAPVGDTRFPALRSEYASVETLPLAWEYRARPGITIQFDGAVDASGNVYWSECDPSRDCDVVSASQDGTIRWRAQAHHDPTSPFFVASDQVIVGVSRPNCALDRAWLPEWGILRALRTIDGGETWSRDVASAGAGWMPEAPCIRGFVGHPTTVDATTVTMNVSVADPRVDGTASGLVSVDTRTGAIAAARLFTPPALYSGTAEPFSNGLGALFVTTYPCAFAQTFDFGADGSRGFHLTEALPDPWLSIPVALSDRYAFDVRPARSGDAIVPVLRWRRLSDGEVRGAVTGIAVRELVAAGDFAAITGSFYESTSASPQDVLAGIDLATGRLRWMRAILASDQRVAPAGTSPTALTLTTHNSVIALAQPFRCDASGTCGSGPSAVIVVDESGRESFRGALRSSTEYFDSHALDRGHLYVAVHDLQTDDDRIQAYHLAGVEPGRQGWITRHGTNARDDVPAGAN